MQRENTTKEVLEEKKRSDEICQYNEETGVKSAVETI